jgi:CTP synthase (UTP-ammonia lyase)
VEFARNVMGLREAGHAELDPAGSCLVVTPLTCSPVGRRMAVQLDRGSRPETWYGRATIREQYYCNYGLNPAFEAVVHDHGLRIVGRDPDGEPRIVDLAGHLFFIGALFVPHPASRGPGHPLVVAWIRAAQARAATRPAGPRQTPALGVG